MNVGVLDILSALGDSGASPALTEISKALTTMGNGTDLSALTGGGAFRVENMDPVLASATVKQEQTDKIFDGKLLLQADKSTPFPALQEVLRAAKSHGYKDIRFVGAKYN